MSKLLSVGVGERTESAAEGESSNSKQGLSGLFWIIFPIALVLASALQGEIRRMIVYMALGVAGSLLGWVLNAGLSRFSAGNIRKLGKYLPLLFVVLFTRLPIVGDRAMGAVDALFPTEEDRLLARLEGHPEAKDWLVKLKAMSKEERTKEGFELASRGIRKLDDYLIVERAKLIARLLSIASETECAEAAKNGTGLLKALVRANQELKNEWINLSLEAIFAQLKGLPERRYSQLDVEAGAQNAMNGLDGPKIMAIANALENPSRATDSDLCFAWRRLHEAVPSLPIRQRLALASMLAGVEPSPGVLRASSKKGRRHE